MTIQGKNVLITGGSRGLGQAVAVRLADQGAQVVLVARDRSDLEHTVDRIRAAGGRAWLIVDDVGEPEAAYRIATQAQALVGDIDVVLQNASTLGALPMPALLDTDPADLGLTFEVNAFGPFRLTRALAGPMLLRGEGTVVSISSDAAVDHYPKWGAYGASKAALDHLMGTFAAELQDSGVRFLVVDPGEMDTKMHADAMPEADRSQLQRPAQVAERLLALLQTPPLAVRVTL